jgi:hypothetical protein
VTSIVGTLNIVGFWNIDTSLDLGIVKVVKEKTHHLAQFTYTT